MTRGAYSVLVSLVALLLVLPIAGTNQNFASNNSELSFKDNIDGSRDDDYSVMIEFAEGNERLFSVTRNEELQGEFAVTNDGTFDDTYDLSVTWDDEFDLGWYAEPDTENVTVSSGTQEVISFTFRAPIQGVYSGDYLEFAVKVTSQNSTTTSASTDQRLEIVMTYAVDVITRESNSQGGDRGDSVTYAVEATNVGENSEERQQVQALIHIPSHHHCELCSALTSGIVDKAVGTDEEQIWRIQAMGRFIKLKSAQQFSPAQSRRL